MAKYLWRFNLVVFGLFLAVMTNVVRAEDEEIINGLRIEPPRVLSVHKLIDQDGHETVFPLSGSDWQLVFFGYTHCANVCPMLLHKTEVLFKELGASSKHVTPVFISIDSGRDKPEVLQTFLKQFDVHAVGLSGDPEVLQTVANEFGVLVRHFQGKTALAYTLEHSSFMYLLDPQGRIRFLYPATAQVTDMAADLHRLWGDEEMARK